MSFGERLKTLRKTNHLTQHQMSEKLHLEQSTYSKYETNKIVPTADVINRVCDEFNISTDWLLERNGNHVNFNDNSTSNGFIQTQNYYAVPKEIVDSLVKQQNALDILMQKLLERL